MNTLGSTTSNESAGVNPWGTVYRKTSELEILFYSLCFSNPNNWDQLQGQE